MTGVYEKGRLKKVGHTFVSKVRVDEATPMMEGAVHSMTDTGSAFCVH